MNIPNVHLTVATVVARDGRFLMVRETDHGRDVLNQPAGHWEPGESLLEAAIRETLEETGWHVAPTAVIGMFLSSNEHAETFCRVAFEARPLREQPDAELDPDILAVEWLSEDELRAQRDKMRSLLVIQTLDAYLAGQRFDLSVVASPPVIHTPNS